MSGVFAQIGYRVCRHASAYIVDIQYWERLIGRVSCEKIEWLAICMICDVHQNE